MTRIFESRGLLGRMRLSTGILLFAAFYGLWEIWVGATSATGGNELLFGVLFIAAATYGFFNLMRDAGNLVARLDRKDATGNLAVTLWRPWGLRVISGPAEQFTNWRFHIAITGRNQRAWLIRFDHPEVKGALAIDVKRETPLDGLRTIAPVAVAEFEERTGAKPQEPAADESGPSTAA